MLPRGSWRAFSVSLAAYLGSTTTKSAAAFSVSSHFCDCTSFRCTSLVTACGWLPGRQRCIGMTPRTVLSSSSTLSWDDGKIQALQKCIVPLSSSSHKGSSGRIGILGGSARYTGAPYYAAMASLKVGADLAYVFCAEEAANAIKCYSPELMVSPVYSAKLFDRAVEQGSEQQEETEAHLGKMVSEVVSMIPRMHTLVVGPGLGRCPLVMEATSRIVQQAIQHDLPLIMDADALYMLTLERYHELLSLVGDYRNVVLTPNVVEFKRLMDAQHRDLGKPFIPDHAIVVKKGQYDEILAGDKTLICNEEGGLKRSGGIGDILAGTLGTFCAWNHILSDEGKAVDLPLSCWSACCVVKLATKRAFEGKRRAMTAPDILDQLGPTFDEMTR